MNTQATLTLHSHDPRSKTHSLQGLDPHHHQAATSGGSGGETEEDDCTTTKEDHQGDGEATE